MTDPTTQKDENIIIRTMKGDLEKLSGKAPEKEKEPGIMPFIPVGPVSQEAQVPNFQAPLPPPHIETKPVLPPIGPPVLIIPPKKVAEIPTKPLFKTTPVWFKIGGIGLGALILVLFGLYGYWKIFIQVIPINPPPTLTTEPKPTLPATPIATTTAPIKFFNKLPNKEITVDIPSKTPAALINALKSEAAIRETLASIKQVKLTYQGKPITTEEFLNLLSVFTPQNFLLNYENEFALAFFSQKEGVRPIVILKIKDKNLAESQMTDWESKTFTTDILPLLLSNNKAQKNISTFKSYLFIGQPVRYLNINLPFSSLNYSIYNHFLIFATSSAGMFTVLQDLTGQGVSLEYMKSLEASINTFVK